MFKRFFIFDSTFQTAWRRVVYLWRPMAVWTLAVWASVAILLAPVSSSLLGLSVFRGDQMIIGNTELIGWVLTPVGITYLILVIALSIISSVIHFAGLFYMITDDLEGRLPSVRKTIVKIIKRLPIIFRLCLVVSVLGILLVIPLAAGLWGIYAFFLGEFDINYYLNMRPTEWRNAILVVIIWSGGWMFGVLYIMSKSLAGLPAYLSGHRPFYKALQQSWKLAKNRSGRLLRLMLGAIGMWILIRLLADTMFFIMASLLMDRVAELSVSLRPTIVVTGLLLIGSFILDGIIAFLGFCFVSTVLTKFYYEYTNLHLSPPSVPGLSEIPGRIINKLESWFQPIRLIPVILILLVASFMISGFLLERMPEARSVMISAHRGGPSSSPENTLSALQKTIESGADYSEIDVQLTRDSIAVLVHDADLMRVAGDSRQIGQSNYEDIRNVVKRPDDGTPPEMRRVATLGEFLEFAKNEVKLMIELKYYGWDPLLAERVIQEVRKHEMTNEVVIMSLSLRALHQVQELAPDIDIGYVSAMVVGDLSRLPVQFIAIARQAVTPDLIRSARSREMEVYAWTINRADVMADMIERGVDGIITDQPKLGVQVREEFSALSTAERLMLRFREFLVEIE